MPITVLIADGMRLFSEALAMALWWSADLQVLGEFPDTGPGAVDAVSRLKPDVALIDYSIPQMDGPAAAAVIALRVPETKVIMMSWLRSPSEIQDSLSAGAVGLLPKTGRVHQVADAIQRAHTGESLVDLQQLENLSDKLREKAVRMAELRNRLAGLTPKELQVLRLLSFGKSIQDIAEELSITQGTVKLHFHNLTKKAGARTKEQVLAMARSIGLIKT